MCIGPRLVVLLTVALLAAASGSVSAAKVEGLFAFKVCQDPNNMPFSNLQEEGIENRIAELFAADLGVPVKYFSFPQRLAFVRNTIRYRLPGEEYRCDVILGVPKGFGQVSTTEPYYRSTYALVFPKGSPLEGVSNTQQFVQRASQSLKPRRLGIHDRSPASALLSKYGLTHLAMPYRMMSPDPDYYPGALIEKDLASGQIDAAIVWGPIAGYFTRKLGGENLIMVPLKSEPGVKFDFEMAMGVRYGEPEWKQVIQDLIDRNRSEITAVLHEYGVPLVADDGEIIPPPTAANAAGLKAERDAQLATANANKAQTDMQSAAAAATGDAPAAEPSTASDVETAQPTKPAKAEGESTSGPLYTVKDGYFVDANTYEGFKTWRAAACDRCHGANQEGLVGPSLIESLKTLSKEEFVVTVRDGRLQKGMQSFGNHKRVMENMDNLWAYLKGRSDGAITRAKVRKLPQ